MKSCPHCRRSYEDETLNFCLEDGEWLVSGNNAELKTAILAENERPSEAPTRLINAQTDPPNSDISPTHSSRQRSSTLLAILVPTVLLIAGFVGYRYVSVSGSDHVESIAVMPFVNASGNPDLEYLSDGITETLIGSLSQLSGLSVKAPSSVFRYKGKEVDTQTIGRELNVQAILNGRVVQRGDDLTLYLSLVDANTENSIWVKQYNRKVINLVSLQTEVAQDVAENLKAKLSGTEEEKLAKTYTSNPEAHQLFLLGRFHWNKRSPEGSKKALEYFNQAIALDPNYALAYSGLADAYAGYIARDRLFNRENVSKGREAAEKALKLDDQLGEAHASFGFILLSDYDFQGAEREFKRAIELNPNYALAHGPYAILLRYLGRFDEAINENRRAVDIEPLSPHLNNSFGYTLIAARRYDEAIAQFQKVIDLESNNVAAYNGLGFAYARKGNYAQAVESFAKNTELAGFGEIGDSMRKGFATEGWQGYLRVVIKQRSDVYIARFNVAGGYLALGDTEEAFNQLNRSFELREPSLAGLKVDPRFDGIRDDPRYHELLKKIGLPD